MRWFKHLTRSRHDERLQAFMDAVGDPLRAVGFWWCLVEIVAEQMEKGAMNPTVEYPLTTWSRLLYSHHNRVISYLGKCQVAMGVTVEYRGSKVRVTIPNILKYRDEYSRKSGQTRARATEQRENIDTDPPPIIPPQGGNGIPKKKTKPKPRAPKWTEFPQGRVVEAAKFMGVCTRGKSDAELLPKLAAAFWALDENQRKAIWEFLRASAPRVAEVRIKTEEAFS